MTTISEIKQQFDTELQAIFSLDQNLAAERSSIKRKAFAEERPLTDDEVTRRKQIASTRGELAEAMEVLALHTVDALDKASDVDKLLRNIEAVNQQLSDDLDHLKKIADYAEKAAAIAKGFAAVTEKLLSFKSSLIA